MTCGSAPTPTARSEALFVSAVGVAPEQFSPEFEPFDQHARGGPDFSCFLISRACHHRFQFDEGFVPAFCEDLDYHRRLMLAGEGHRIFSVNLPYLHYGSATLKAMEPGARATVEEKIERQSRAYYQRKWGGPVNAERFVRPFCQTEDRDVSTPALQTMVQADREYELPRVDPWWFEDQGTRQEEANRAPSAS